jgi:formylglycine-generating enzyme required for sulfatase activity
MVGVKTLGERTHGVARGGVSSRVAAAAVAALVMGASTVQADTPSLKERAEKEAQKLRDQAPKARAALPAAQQARDAAQAKYDAARPKLEADRDACVALAEVKKKRLIESLVACDEKAAPARQAAEARAAAAREALVSQLQRALEACNQQAARGRATCEDNCSSTAIRCRKANWDRPNARDACDGTENECKGRCGESEERACVTVSAQLDKASSSGEATTPQLDPCAPLRREAEAQGSDCSRALESSMAPLERANAEVARLKTAAQGDAAADKLVADAARCGTLTATFVPKGKVTLGETHATSDVDAFCMDRTEVTTAAYAACVKSGKCTKADTGGSCNAGVAGRENHPINCVNWNQAKAYCEAQGQRLPTEEEWEYAATGGDGRTYPWGNDAPSDQLCWNAEGNDLGKGNRRSTCAVGSYPNGNSPFGLSDMSGNVWEWTSSAYNSSSRVFRGGCWYFDVPSRVRSAYRRWVIPAGQFDNLGFRCAGSRLP